jgi:hypothetical protein
MSRLALGAPGLGTEGNGFYVVAEIVGLRIDLGPRSDPAVIRKIHEIRSPSVFRFSESGYVRIKRKRQKKTERAGINQNDSQRFDIRSNPALSVSFRAFLTLAFR